MKPTEEQIKKFWEWCGLIYTKTELPVTAGLDDEA